MTDNPTPDESPFSIPGRLHPDSAPGVMSTALRSFLGDEAYERTVAANNTSADLRLERATLAVSRDKLVNALVAVLVLVAMIVGLCVVVAAPVALVRWVL